MSLLPRTLGGQLLALLLGALALSQAIAFVVYSNERAQAIRAADRSGLIEAAASVMRVIQLAPVEQRALLARAASSGRVQIWTTEASAVPAQAATDTPGVQFEAAVPATIARLLPRAQAAGARWQVVRDSGQVAMPFPPPTILPPANPGEAPVAVGNWTTVVQPAEAPDGTPGRIVGGSPLGFGGDRYDVMLSIPFPDDGWLNAQTQIRAEPVTWAWPSLAATGVMGLAILAIVGFTSRRATGSLRLLAARADALGRGTPGPPVEPGGPDEVQRVATAFNRMQERLQRFVSDRTRMIAAIGHDLRTPITSLRLRAELLDDDETKAKMLATLEEMQKMVEATLAFAREEATAEEPRSVDLAALIGSVVDDRADLGETVSFAESERLAYVCRPTALRRAIDNLVGNAVQYGGVARVSLKETASGPVVRIDDDGPGIPRDKIEEVFQPFVRLEESRNRATGGVGLGLSIARSIVLAHGGEIVLANRPEGGLRAEIRLPPGGRTASATEAGGS